uniref:Uncharacterized protein n=1 Tax=Globisporangium ultimum (strain ATCC 200006 / CBS 805.95 / DAOM BR144) TaxID=431595 RepID=K3WZD0_GLOUD
MDPLTEPFADLCHALRSMRGQVQELVKVHESIDAFNAAFGAFQTAMALHASCLEFPAPQKKVSIHLSSGIPAPQLSLSGIASLSNKRLSRESAGSSSSLKLSTGNATTMGRTGSTKGRHSSTGSKGGKASLTGASAQKKAGATGKAALQKRKSAASNKRQESPAWKWDKHIRDQIPRKYQSNEELKKLENILLYMKNRRSGIGLAVIKSKEILQTLMKVDLIHREHEKSGFVYTFGSAP